MRLDHVDAETLDQEGHFDLVILSLHRKKLEEAAAYGERLRSRKPDLPILLLTDTGVFVPHGALNPGVETGFPSELMHQIAHMLAGSTHIREIEPKAS